VVEVRTELKARCGLETGGRSESWEPKLQGGDQSVEVIP